MTVDPQSSWIDKFLELVDRLITLAASFMLGAQVGEEKAAKADADRQLAETEKKEAQIDLEVDKENRGKSARDIILDAAGDGSDDGST